MTHKDFKKVKSIGAGACGNVYLVERKGKFYAMKIIRKSLLFKYNLHEPTLLERHVLLNNGHPFIVDLDYCFQNNSKIYLIMDFCEAGDLWKILYRERRFSPKIS